MRSISQRKWKMSCERTCMLAEIWGTSIKLRKGKCKICVMNSNCICFPAGLFDIFAPEMDVRRARGGLGLFPSVIQISVNLSPNHGRVLSSRTKLDLFATRSPFGHYIENPGKWDTTKERNGTTLPLGDRRGALGSKIPILGHDRLQPSFERRACMYNMTD